MPGKNKTKIEALVDDTDMYDERLISIEACLDSIGDAVKELGRRIGKVEGRLGLH